MVCQKSCRRGGGFGSAFSMVDAERGDMMFGVDGQAIILYKI